MTLNCPAAVKAGMKLTRTRTRLQGDDIFGFQDEVVNGSM